jgi:hypothetical protein
MPAARDLAVAVRPEDLELAADAPEGVPRAVVTLRSFVGDGFEYRLDLQGQSLRARCEKSVQFAEGAQVGLHARRAVLVDATSDPDGAVIAP